MLDGHHLNAQRPPVTESPDRIRPHASDQAKVAERTPSGVRNQLWVVLSLTVAASALSMALPEISLNTTFADLVVVVTDTASWPQMAIVSGLALFVVISRSGIDGRRRRLEIGAGIAVMLIALAANVLLNEHAMKPVFGIARPNIATLVDDGVLGDGVGDTDAFYAAGNKEARRDVLRNHLTGAATPFLSDRVRAHWAHETGYSFPSGHATAAMTLTALMVALGLVWLDGWRRVLAVVTIPVWAVAVVYSRVLLGVHTPVDVIVGTLAGVAWGLGAFIVFSWVVERVAAGKGSDAPRSIGGRPHSAEQP